MPKRTIFIWDIHGCYDEFKLLIKKLKLQENDIVYLVWDVINKWPKSWKTLKFLFKNRKQFKVIIGNNEINFIRDLKGEEQFTDISKASLKEFSKLKEKIILRPGILEYLETLPLYIEWENFLLIHWWLIPWKSFKEHNVDEITRIREIEGKPWYDSYKWDKKVMYWHWAFDWLRVRENTVWLDTWCVYGKALTAYILESGEIIQQSALDIYVNIYKKDENKWIKKL